MRWIKVLLHAIFSILGQRYWLNGFILNMYTTLCPCDIQGRPQLLLHYKELNLTRWVVNTVTNTYRFWSCTSKIICAACFESETFEHKYATFSSWAFWTLVVPHTCSFNSCRIFCHPLWNLTDYPSSLMFLCQDKLQTWKNTHLGYEWESASVIPLFDVPLMQNM